MNKASGLSEGNGFDKPLRFVKPLILIIFSLHFLPFLLNTPNAYLRIHDNLEGEWVWLELLVRQGKALDFSPGTTVHNVLNGQPRAAFPTGLSLNVLMIWLFGTYWGYIVNYFILHLLAFAGMYLLLTKHFLTDENNKFIVIGVALCFSLVPFYPQFGVAGQPLLLYCFLNILKERGRWFDFLYIVFFPVISSLVWTGVSAIAALGLLLIVNANQRRSLNGKFLLALALHVVSYSIVNFQMFALSFFNKDFISHREEYNLLALRDLSFVKGILDSIYPLLLTHYHVGTIVTLSIFATVALAYRYAGKSKIINWLLISIVAICFIYGFYFYVEFFLGDVFPLLITFKANRFIILLPLLLFLMFAVSLKKIRESGIPKYAVMTILCCQLAIGFFANDEWLHNMRNLFGHKIKPAYKDFFAEDIFHEIDAHIGLPKNSYRVASLGMSPSVAQHNGFYTLDGLLSIYSLEHKQQFREIIAPELEKNETIRNYFDGWGNRCYVFSSELGVEDRNYIIGKNRHVTLKDFEINAAAFKKIGGRYLFSAVEIQQPERTGLQLVKVFGSGEGLTNLESMSNLKYDSWWKIYLYEAI